MPVNMSSHTNVYPFYQAKGKMRKGYVYLNPASLYLEGKACHLASHGVGRTICLGKGGRGGTDRREGDARRGFIVHHSACVSTEREGCL